MTEDYYHYQENDSIDNEDVYKVYKMIKSLCGNDQEIMEMLNKIKLPNPRTASESIEKINAEHVSGEGLDDLIKYVDDNLPHYNETLITEISGEDFNFIMNNGYVNISALSLDETKLYILRIKQSMNSPTEHTYRFVYDKEADTLINHQINIYNHKSFDGTNLTQDENSAVVSFYAIPTIISDERSGYLKLYEVEKLELDNNCLSDNVSIVNSLTVGIRIGDIGVFSTVEGNENKASGTSSHAEGELTTASSYASHAEGSGTTSRGNSSHAEGSNTVAGGDYSHAEGYYTIASSNHQHAQGKYNIEDREKKYAHIVGNGTSSIDRSNAHTLDWNGNGWYAGKLTQEGAPTEDKDLTTKKYVDDKTASIDTTINNNLPSNGALTLTTNKFQTTTLATDTEVILPTVEGYTEIHLFFLGISGTNVSDTNVAWNNKPTIEDNKKYEFIYTYVNSEIGWLGKAVVYTV